VAEHVPIPGSAQGAKIRNVFAVAILSVVTLGIYVVFWWYFVNREMADLGRARQTNELGTSPWTSVLAVTLGALVIVPAIMSIIGTFRRVQATQRLTGQTQVINGWLGLVLLVVIAPAFYAYMQSGLNSSWEALRGEAPAPAPSQAPA
jgi:membrane protease YdiL (CAAX protease family)